MQSQHRSTLRGVLDLLASAFYVLVRKGDRERVQDMLKILRRIAQRAGEDSQFIEAHGLAIEADVNLSEGRLEEAAGRYEEAASLFGPGDEQFYLLTGGRARVLHSSGQADMAARILTEALRVGMASGADSWSYGALIRAIPPDLPDSALFELRPVLEEYSTRVLAWTPEQFERAWAAGLSDTTDRMTRDAERRAKEGLGFDSASGRTE